MALARPSRAASNLGREEVSEVAGPRDRDNALVEVHFFGQSKSWWPMTPTMVLDHRSGAQQRAEYDASTPEKTHGI